MPRCSQSLAVSCLVMVGLAVTPALAQVGGSAAAPEPVLQPLDAVLVVDVPPIALNEVQLEDEQRENLGLAPRFAIPWEVQLTPESSGTWEAPDEKASVWRLRIVSPGALSLNLGFTRYHMPRGGQLVVYASDLSYSLPPFTDLDNEDHGELWTPVVLADDIVVEVTVPADAVDELELELGSINHGYRGFGEIYDDRSGSCNNDVVCPEGDAWQAEIRSVGVISTGGSTFCTGFMVNNTAEDQTPYFMTANHCGITSGNASSLVVYWNFESPTCGQQGGGSLSDSQTGSYWRSTYTTSDFTLVELDDTPNPNHHVTFSGWDRGGADATSAVAIHHPNTDEKAISFEYAATTVTTYLGTSVPGDGTHVRVIDWDDGTTEPGSSGSPLYDQNHRVIGQLHGGYAACGNDESDWYGRFYTSWTGGGSNSSRLSNWLDPASTGATFVDTLDPEAIGMAVSPASGLDSAGDPGGPFTPASTQYTIENNGATGFNYSVTKTVNWLTLTNASGYIPVSGSAIVTVSINSNANSLGIGTYDDTVEFTNLTSGEGDTTRAVSLQVGGPSVVYSWDMDTNPGWGTQGQWAWGQPTGDGGAYGNPDPTSGHTGSNVYGYNLSGDYANSLSEQYLTTTAIDCTDLSVVELRFWRWFNVETADYDHAYVRVSNNGSSWTTIWQNPGGTGNHVEDSSWSQQTFDISSVADGESTVYIRWVMGSTDGSWTFSGWNVDDVEIWAIDASQASGCPNPGAMGFYCVTDVYPNNGDGAWDYADDGDCIVDMGDLGELLANYGMTSGATREHGDVYPTGTADGAVDMSDLGELLAQYGDDCN